MGTPLIRAPYRAPASACSIAAAVTAVLGVEITANSLFYTRNWQNRITVRRSFCLFVCSPALLQCCIFTSLTLYQVGPQWPRKTPATPPPTPHSLFLNGIEQRSSGCVGWYPAARRKHDVTASRKKRPDSVIWLVSVPTTSSFDRP